MWDSDLSSIFFTDFKFSVYSLCGNTLPKNTLPHPLSVQSLLPPSPVRTHSSPLCHTQWLYISALLLSTLHTWTWAGVQSLTGLLLLEHVRVRGFGSTKEIFRTFYFLYSEWLLITNPTAHCISWCCLLPLLLNTYVTHGDWCLSSLLPSRTDCSADKQFSQLMSCYIQHAGLYVLERWAPHSCPSLLYEFDSWLSAWKWWLGSLHSVILKDICVHREVRKLELVIYHPVRRLICMFDWKCYNIHNYGLGYKSVSNGEICTQNIWQ